MGSLKGKLKYLEREAAGCFETLRLEDGTEVRYEPNEMLSALAAYMEGQEHWLLPHIMQADTRQGIPGMIRMLEESRKLY
jgi:hypothetical protein